jgi:hypothetical protein
VRTKIIEVTNGFNWGKFMLGQFDEEWSYRSKVDAETRMPLLRARGWGPEHLLVLDLQTGEGVVLRPGGNAKADLNEHRVWVCPMFEPFLMWLYKQPDPRKLYELPDIVTLSEAEAPSDFRGYRRQGPPTER